MYQWICLVNYTAPIVQSPSASNLSLHYSEEQVQIVDLSEIPDDTTLGKCIWSGIASIVNIHYTCVADANTHLSILMTALNDVVCEWRELGIHLGLKHSSLKVIMKNRRDQQRDCLIDMLDAWQNGEGHDCNKQNLRRALEKIKCNIFDWIVWMVSLVTILS